VAAPSILDLSTMQISDTMSNETDTPQVKAAHPNFMRKAWLMENCLMVSAEDREGHPQDF
jgi:hypothetical protein